MGGVADANRADTMGASDELHRVLDGTVSVSELESDSKSYYLAERIYGRETLEELGVSPPKISFRESGAVHETERIDHSSSPKLSFPLLEDEGSIPDMPTDSITDNLRNIVGSSRMRNWFIFAIAIRIIIAPWTSHLTDAVVHYLAVTDMLNGSSPYASLDFPYPPVFAIILYPLFWVLSHFSEP